MYQQMKPKQLKIMGKELMRPKVWQKAASKSSKILNLAGDSVIFGASATAQPELLPVGAGLRGAGALVGRASNLLKK